MREKPKMTTIGHPSHAAPPGDLSDVPGGDFDAQMPVAEKIMDEDREILRVMADVMARRRNALRKLAE